MAAFRMEFPTRPCLVKGKKHIFHQWENRAWVAEPGIMVGSAPGGQCSMTLAIVEDEYGQVHEVYPKDVRFIDERIKEYDFGDASQGLDEQLTLEEVMGNE